MSKAPHHRNAAEAAPPQSKCHRGPYKPQVANLCLMGRAMHWAYGGLDLLFSSAIDIFCDPVEITLHLKGEDIVENVL